MDVVLILSINNCSPKRFIMHTTDRIALPYIWHNILQVHMFTQCGHLEFALEIFKYIFFNENVWIPIKISLAFVPKVQINNIPALVQITVWRRPGDKPAVIWNNDG